MALETKDFAHPDEKRPFEDKGYLEVLQFDDTTVGRGIFEPGWRWSQHVKPIANTKSCQAAHTAYVVQGRMHIAMDDGDELDLKAGDVVRIPPGHDAWVVGDETCVILDFSGAETYARRMAERGEQPAPAAP
jgi:quercetin dioxygenase-like cupin family protein